MLEYLDFLDTKHRAILDNLKKQGKSYRSRAVALEQGYLMALADMEDAIRLPQKNAELREAMTAFGEKLKG